MGQLISNQLCKSTTDSVFTGVCGGLAKRFKIESWIIRVIFVLGAMVGLTALLYFIFVFSFPKDTEAHEAYESKILGVCSRLSKKLDWDVAVTRSVFLFSLIASLVPSFGTTLLIYFVLHFLLPEHGVSKPNIVDVNTKDIN